MHRLHASKTVNSYITRHYYNGDSIINEMLNGMDYAICDGRRTCSHGLQRAKKLTVKREKVKEIFTQRIPRRAMRRKRGRKEKLCRRKPRRISANNPRGLCCDTRIYFAAGFMPDYASGWFLCMETIIM